MQIDNRSGTLMKHGIPHCWGS